MLHYSAAAGCRILLANARLSARSARGYGRVPGLTRTMLQQLDCVAAQSQADGERLLSLGLSATRLHVTGSIKFDLELGAELQQQAQALATAWAANARPVVVAASTHPGEDELILAAFAELRQAAADCLLVLVPRHPERFENVHRLCRQAGWQVVRRSAGEVPGATDAVLLGDTMGELVLLLSAADIAVIGGSFVPHGGHNVLEAAAWGVPVVTGPYMFNFADVSALMVAAGAMRQLRDNAGLGGCLSALMADAGRRQRMGEAGRSVVAGNRGAQERLLALVAELL